MKSFKAGDPLTLQDNSLFVIAGVDSLGNVRPVSLNTSGVIQQTSNTRKFATVTATSSGDTTVVAAVSAKKLRVFAYSLSTDTLTNIFFRDGAAGTQINHTIYLATRDTFSNETSRAEGLFSTLTVNTALTVNLSVAANVSITVCYEEY